MQNIKNIIFDYGNVIFSLDFNRTQQAFKDMGIADIDSFFSHLKQDPIFDSFDRGQVSPAQFRDYVRQLTGNSALTDEQIDDAWNSILVGVAAGNHELLLKVKQRYRTFLLSNTNAIHHKWFTGYLKREFGFEGNDHLFEKVYYSHLIGKRKPDAEIFNHVLQENGLKAEETLFIDDSPQHIRGAQALGIHTHLLTAPETIQTYFEHNGLLD